MTAEDARELWWAIKTRDDEIARLWEEQREFRSRLNTITSKLAHLQHRVTRIETEDDPT